MLAESPPLPLLDALRVGSETLESDPDRLRDSGPSDMELLRLLLVLIEERFFLRLPPPAPLPPVDLSVSSLVRTAGELGAFPSSSSKKSWENDNLWEDFKDVIGEDDSPGISSILTVTYRDGGHFPSIDLEWTWDHLMPDWIRRLASFSSDRLGRPFPDRSINGKNRQTLPLKALILSSTFPVISSILD